MHPSASVYHARLMDKPIRFIHPSDPQWKGGKEGLLSSSFETYKGSKYRHSSSVSLPYRRQPSSPMMQLGDSSRRKHDDGERDRECSQRDRRKHEFEYRGRFTQERGATLKGTSDRRSYAYHCSRTESVSRPSRPSSYQSDKHPEAGQVCVEDRKY